MPNKKITVLLTESDMQELQSGKAFDWTFDRVDVHIATSEQSCSECCADIETGEEVEKDEEVYCKYCAK